MYMVNKGTECITLADIESAKALMRCLSDMDCPEPISKKTIIGTKNRGKIYILSTKDHEIRICGMQDAFTAGLWLMKLSAEEITIKSDADEE